MDHERYKRVGGVLGTIILHNVIHNKREIGQKS